MTQKQQFLQCAEIDPISTAPTFDYCLAIEVQSPWSTNVWESEHVPDKLRLALDKVSNLGLSLKLVAIQPDVGYSREGHTRIIRYSRPKEPFAQFEKLEYVVPDALAPALVVDMFDPADILGPFDPYRQDTEDIRELFVCIHKHRQNCCHTFGYPIYRMLRTMYPPRTKHPFRVWRTSHIGGSHLAATMLDFPYGHYWGHLNRDVLSTLLEYRGTAEAIHPFYRGWSGLDAYCQVVEREIWMLDGWAWLDYEKSGRVCHENEHGAEVEIKFRSPDGRDEGTYMAQVRYSDELGFPEYRVSHLEKVQNRELVFA